MAARSNRPRVSVVGAGAVGSYFGGLLARAGAPVTLIGRNPHIEAIHKSGLFIDSLHFQETIRTAATTSIAGLRDAEIVLFCVKSYDTEQAARDVAAHAPTDAIIVSLQNGVDNVERIRAIVKNPVVAAAVYVAAELVAPGRIKHSGAGSLAIGDFWKRDGAVNAAVRKVADLFSRAAVPCRTSDDIQSDLWTKLVMNCAYNAISALCRARYGLLSADPLIQQTMRQVVAEIGAVAHAAGIAIPSAEVLMESVLKLGTTMPNALSSTAQDVQRGKRTEIDSLNGYVARRGKELGIPTPANQTLHALVKLLEQCGGSKPNGR